MKAQREVLHLHSIKADVKSYILKNFLPGEDMDSLLDDDLLFEGGIIDSAGAMTLISYLEHNFGIELLDEELFPENFATVAHIVEYLMGKLQRS